MPLKDAANELKNSDNSYVSNLANFVLESKRGIAYKRSQD